MALKSRLMRVQMLLRHVLYINYLVPAPRVSGLVSGRLPLALVGGDSVFISVVAMRCTGVRLSLLPVPRFDYTQVNVRTYVRDPSSGKQAAGFLKSGVTSRAVSLLTRSAGIPWQHVPFDSKFRAGERGGDTSVEIAGRWDGEFLLAARGTSTRPVVLPPFDHVEGAVDYLVRPLIGFFSRGERVRRFTIYHADVSPYLGELRRFHFPMLTALGLLEEEEIRRPSNILFVPEARFDVFLPPVEIGKAWK